jgi:hypothetical protein
LQDYHIPTSQAILIGGGGGAGAIVPFTGEKMMHLPWKIAENAPVISAIGVALALVRDVLEKNITNPTKDDILKIRREAIDAVVRSGADYNTVEVAVDIDTQLNIIRATATGSLKMELKKTIVRNVNADDLKIIASKSMGCKEDKVVINLMNTGFAIYSSEKITKKLLGLFNKKTTPMRVIDFEGAIRLQFENAQVIKCSPSNSDKAIRKLIAEFAEYGDGGEKLPAIFIISTVRIINLSGLSSIEQVLAISDVELASYSEDEEIIIIAGVQI